MGGDSLAKTRDEHYHRDHDALLEAIRSFRPSMTEAEHVFHGRGGLYPGYEHLMVDWYPPVWVITSFQPINNATNNTNTSDYVDNDHNTSSILHTWQDALSELWHDVWQMDGPMTLVYQDRSVSPTMTHLLAGNIPDPHIVMEGKNRYQIQLLKGRQNHGLFLDMAKGREWVQGNAMNRTVLNMFAYTCSFSIAALMGGASSVVNIDMAHGPLKVGQRNHEWNGLLKTQGRQGTATTAKAGGNSKHQCSTTTAPGGSPATTTPTTVRFLNHDIFKSWGKLKQLGPYDLVICDPPSYQKGSFVAKKDYGKIIRRLPSLLLPQNPEGSYALLCLNAPELDSHFLMDLVAREAPVLVFVRRLENPASYPTAFPERALKVLLFRLEG